MTVKNFCYTLFAIAFSLALGKLTHALISGLPASLYGMIFYCVFLQLNWFDANKVSQVNLWLVKHMGVCFVPAGIGIINHFDLIKQHGVALIGIIFISTFILLTLIGWLSERFLVEKNSTSATISNQ
ncbi:CidA/LrgA family protein [Colwellia sp. D2M02]|uniref:Antiholin-like murein hydrolase modulator LrgA n=1 Tax=Colwellia asteriadis TaxID=517723 RepID=A0ABN1L9I2_9GAMM|nr:CidA/LrgA family protein [Colwellia sp. D2M02]MBU2892720.1 CidA/LrgA family protein [Colwellia sp. D2M02]